MELLKNWRFGSQTRNFDVVRGFKGLPQLWWVEKLWPITYLLVRIHIRVPIWVLRAFHHSRMKKRHNVISFSTTIRLKSHQKSCGKVDTPHSPPFVYLTYFLLLSEQAKELGLFFLNAWMIITMVSPRLTSFMNIFLLVSPATAVTVGIAITMPLLSCQVLRELPPPLVLRGHCCTFKSYST